MVPELTALLAGATAFLATAWVVPRLSRVSGSLGLSGRIEAGRGPDYRRVPRSGGLAIGCGLLAGVLVAAALLPVGSGAHGPSGLSFPLRVLAGASILVVLGYLDDVRSLSPITKLFVQVLAAVPVAVAPLGGFEAIPVSGWDSLLLPVLTVCWLVFVTNSVNLLDGLDGLAGGVVVIAVCFLAVMAGFDGWTMVLSTVLVGSLVGFLRFNMAPAQAFMGDTGSLLSGYLLGVLALSAFSTSPTLPRALAVLVVIGLPGLDTALAIARRTLRGVSPFRADEDHIHHRMLRRMRGSHGRAAVAFFLCSLALGLLGLLVAVAGPPVAIVLFAVALLLGGSLCFVLGYFAPGSTDGTEVPPGGAASHAIDARRPDGMRRPSRPAAPHRSDPVERG